MSKHRAINFLVVTCKAPDDFFLSEWEDIPEESRNLIDANNGLPCEGGGVPGTWCYSCPWRGEHYYDDHLVDDYGADYLEDLNNEESD